MYCRCSQPASTTRSGGAVRSQLTSHYVLANGAVCWACSPLHEHHTVYCLDTPQTNTLAHPRANTLTRTVTCTGKSDYLCTQSVARPHEGTNHKNTQKQTIRMPLLSDEKLVNKLFPKAHMLRTSDKHFCLFDKLCQLMGNCAIPQFKFKQGIYQILRNGGFHNENDSLFVCVCECVCISVCL